MKTCIKLCGLKNIDDIMFATSLDINYLGMIFVENLPRSIDINTAIQATTICKEKNIKSVGVFLNQDTDTVDKFSARSILTYYSFMVQRVLLIIEYSKKILSKPYTSQKIQYL